MSVKLYSIDLKRLTSLESGKLIIEPGTAPGAEESIISGFLIYARKLCDLKEGACKEPILMYFDLDKEVMPQIQLFNQKNVPLPAIHDLMQKYGVHYAIEIPKIASA